MKRYVQSTLHTAVVGFFLGCCTLTNADRRRHEYEEVHTTNGYETERHPGPIAGIAGAVGDAVADIGEGTQNILTSKKRTDTYPEGTYVRKRTEIQVDTPDAREAEHRRTVRRRRDIIEDAKRTRPYRP